MRWFNNIDLYTWYSRLPNVVRSILDVVYNVVPSRFLRSKRTRIVLSELLQSQYVAPESLRSLQFERLKELLCTAKNDVPYYRDLFDRIDFQPEDMKELEKIRVIPILTLHDVKKHANRMVSERIQSSNTYLIQTSGSTGNFLEFRRDKEYYEIEHAFTMRYYAWYGIQPKWRHAIFYRAIMKHPRFSEQHPPYELFRNRLILSQFHTDHRSLEYYSQLLMRFRADFMTIFPSTLLIFTRWCSKHMRDIVRPKVIISYSENLYDEHRKEMEDFWGCKIMNRYGHSEGCVSAGSCEHGRLHISAEYGYIEFLRTDGSVALPGERARIVATGFFTSAMPFIRYDTGDWGALDPNPCPCGKSLPVLAWVDGRGDDILETSDGKKIAALRSIFANTSGILFTQIVQERIGEIIVRIVPDDEYHPSAQDIILRNVRDSIGNGLNVRFEIVDDVERTPSGKIRLVVSHIKHDENSGIQD